MLRASDEILAKNLGIIRRNKALLEGFLSTYSELFEWVRPSAGAVGFVRFKGPLTSVRMRGSSRPRPTRVYGPHAQRSRPRAHAASMRRVRARVPPRDPRPDEPQRFSLAMASTRASRRDHVDLPPSFPFHIPSSDSLLPILSCVHLLPSLPPFRLIPHSHTFLR